MQQQPPTWIVVVGAGRARILELQHPEASARRVFADEPDQVQPELADCRLAGSTAGVVNAATREQRCGRLVLVAPPPVLDELHTRLHARVHVDFEVEHDLSRFSDEQIVSVVGEALAAPDAGSGADGAHGSMQ